MGFQNGMELGERGKHEINAGGGIRLGSPWHHGRVQDNTSPLIKTQIYFSRGLLVLRIIAFLREHMFFIRGNAVQAAMTPVDASPNKLLAYPELCHGMRPKICFLCHGGYGCKCCATHVWSLACALGFKLAFAINSIGTLHKHKTFPTKKYKKEHQTHQGFLLKNPVTDPFLRALPPTHVLLTSWPLP